MQQDTKFKVPIESKTKLHDGITLFEADML